MPAVSECSGIDVARHKETLARGRTCETQGDDAGAERCFREVLDATRGSGTVVAWVALSNLTGLYLRQDRESESLVLSRRLIEDAEGMEPFRGAWARQARCMALANIEEWRPLAAELPRFEAAIPGCPDPFPKVYSRSVLALRATVALQIGSLEDAREAHARLLSSLDDAAAANTRAIVHLMGADIEWRSGRIPEALAAARRARPFAYSPMQAIGGIELEAKCLFELEGPTAALDAVRCALDAIDASPQPEVAPAHLVRSGPKLADLVLNRCGDEALARRVYDLAAAAVVRRTAEIERAVADLPELAPAHPDDEASLAAYRARFLDDRRAFLRAIATVLARGSGAPAFLRRMDETIQHVCAWCLTVLRADGSRVPVGHLVAASPPGGVTHGICPACEESAYAMTPVD